MWACQKCGEQIEDQFDSCWKCAASATTPEAGPGAASASGESPLLPDQEPMECLRCHGSMNYVGSKSFHVGVLIATHERFNLYACSRCGRVELFMD